MRKAKGLFLFLILVIAWAWLGQWQPVAAKSCSEWACTAGSGACVVKTEEKTCSSTCTDWTTDASKKPSGYNPNCCGAVYHSEQKDKCTCDLDVDGSCPSECGTATYYKNCATCGTKTTYGACPTANPTPTPTGSPSGGHCPGAVSSWTYNN